MKGGAANKKAPDPLPANVDQSELASSQNATPVPWFCGKRLVAAQWVSPIYNLVSHGGPVTKK